MDRYDKRAAQMGNMLVLFQVAWLWSVAGDVFAANFLLGRLMAFDCELRPMNQTEGKHHLMCDLGFIFFFHLYGPDVLTFIFNLGGFT